MSFTLKIVGLKNTGGPLATRADHLCMAAIIGPGGPSTATKIAVDGPGGEHLRRGTNCGMTDLNKK